MNKGNLNPWKYLAALVFPLLLPAVLLGQDELPTQLGGASRAGTAGAQFLQLGISARATGMGETFVALVNDVSAVYYNPGALTELEENEAMFNHTTLPGGLRHFFAAVAHPFGPSGVLAVSFNMLTTGDIPVTRAFEGPTGETFSASESAVGITYARKLTDRFSVGGTAKLILEDFAGFDDRVVAFDLGTLYHTGFRKLNLGMSVSNFGPDLNFGRKRDSEGNLTFKGQSFPLPITFRFGVSVDVVNTEESKVFVGAQLVQPNDNLRYETLGFEYSWNDILFLRGGFKVDEESDKDAVGDSNGFSENVSAGAGLKASLSGFTGRFDVSWVNQENLNNLVRFSIHLMF
ncbi:MAG: hypothetical protein D6743_11410 [Calditrichaeota bacterium]|nr:MAG: hypothetical protein D6743_11410 [Calditrichota bacterium]